MRYTWEPLSPESQTVCLWALHIHIADGSICPWTCGLPWPERRVRAGEGAPGTWTHTAHSPLDGHASPPTPTSFVFSALTSSSSVLISSDLLLADNNRNKEQHRFLACVRFFPPLIFSQKKKKSSLFYRLILFQKRKKKKKRQEELWP